MDSDKELDQDLTPALTAVPNSPRQPATKRSKECSPLLDESETTYEQDLLNHIGWIIHTLTTETEKRKAANTASRPIDDCLTRLYSISKTVRKSVNQNRLKRNIYDELIEGFVDKYTSICTEKDSIISLLKIKLQEAQKTATTQQLPHNEIPTKACPSYAQTTSRSRPELKNRKEINIERSKSRAKANKRRTEMAINSPLPTAFYINTEGTDQQTAKADIWQSVIKRTKAPKINIITTRAGKLIAKPQNRESADILKDLSKSMPDSITEDNPMKPRVIITNMCSTMLPSEIPQHIARQNPELLIEEDKANQIITPIFKRGKRYTPTTNWVCEIASSRISKFEEITQCFRCLSFGHTIARCNKNTETCSHCSLQGHKYENCPKKEDPPKCSNCGGAHSARDLTCSKRAITLANRQKRNDYGSPNEDVSTPTA